MLLFTEQADRAKAMGVFGFVLSGGGVIGVLAGGILTDLLSWHWIFFINLPVGIAVFVLSLRLLPAEHGPAATGKVDYAGAITVTAALMLAVYAIVNGNEEGWTSVQTLGMLGAAAALIAVFLVIESRVASPLVPLGLFRNRNVSTVERRRRADGGRACSPTSSSRRSTSSSCSSTPRWRSVSRTCPAP